MRGFFEFVVRELEVDVALLLAEVTREVAVSMATPAREGRAIVRAARMLGIGRERALLRWSA